MSHYTDNQSRAVLDKAEKRLDMLEKLPNQQWTLVNNTTSKDKIYRTYTTSDDHPTWKVEKQLHANQTNLDYIKTCLLTIDLRPQWYPWFTEYKVLDKPSSHVHIIQAKTTDDHSIDWVEKVMERKRQVRYVACSMHSAINYYLAIHVETSNGGSTRAVVYYQWDPSTATHTSDILSSVLDNLCNLCIFSWISQSDKAIDIKRISYTQDTCEIDYTCQQKETKLPAPAVDIHKINQQHRWHSGSWDQQSSLSQTLRKNKFLSSSSLVFNSASSSPQLHPITRSSYPENQHMFPWLIEDEREERDLLYKQLDSDELRIQATDMPQLSISLVDKQEWSDKFAQLYVRCFYRQPLSNKANYVIQILHPHKWMQYFKEHEEETMRLDDEDEMTPIHVKLVLRKSKDSRCTVNNNEWPIRSWRLSSSDEEENDSCHTDEDEDIFVDGMEEINSPKQTEMPKINIPLMKPSSSAPVPTLQTLPQHDVPFAEFEEKKAASIQEPVDTTSFVDTIPIEKTKEPNIPSLSQEADQLPETDPAALLKVYPQFIEYLQLSSSPIVQAPTRENGYVTVRRFDIAHHPMGGFLSESIWKDCSIWDIKAVIESTGARRIWDNTFESTTLLHALTPTSSLWHTKVKGAWPIQPRDYVCFHGQYTSSGVPRIDLLSTSCLGDSFQYKPLPPKQIPGYTRAIMDIMGWRLERVDETKALVRQVLVTQFPSWVIQYITSRFSVQTCSAVQFAQDYLEKHGAPPSLESLSCALLVDVKHDHERKSWRCEYTRRTDKNESDVGPLNTPSTVSVIRLDKRRWATRNAYAVVIDPPPSRVSATEKSCDPYGVWLTVEHDEAFIIPLRGKILVLIKPEESPSNHNEGCLLNVNGIATPIQREETKLIPTPKPKEEKTAVEPELTEEEQVSAALDKVSPKDHAQAALLFLKQTDEQFGWTVLSDNHKSGMRISKKPGIKNSQLPLKDNHEMPSKLQVFDPYMVYKGTKVIENFSADEVLAVVKDTDYVRIQYDDTIESPIELVRQTNYPACKVIRYAVKAMFPFKNREVYAVSCLAHETLSSKRTFYIESSLPDFPLINPKKTRGHLFMSGWILEEIDPYNTTTANHPIPSTRITYVAALDLGNSVPSYISNLVANNWFPKKIQAVESYLKSKGPPPFITQPDPAFVLSGNTLDKDKEDVKWKTIYSNFDKKHQFEIKTRLEVNENTSNKKTQQQKTEEGTASPYRRPSHHTISASTDTQGRRGSLPTTILAKKRVVMTPSSSATTNTTTPLTEKSPSTTKSYTLLHTTFDLRAYTKGYEIEAQLYDVSDSNHVKNISNKLVLSISEPSLSQLMDGKKKSTKHTITVKTQQGVSLFKSIPALFEFEFKLIPIRQEAATSTTKLTVSHVLGEDEDDGKEKWRGTIMVNGIEAQLNAEVPLKSLLANEEKAINSNTNDETIPQDNRGDIANSEPNSQIDNEATLSLDDNASKTQIESENSSQYIGGSVVATALENVSAGVNTIGARMMIPFRAASNSFLSSNMNEQISLEDQQTSSEEEEEQKEEAGIRIQSFTREERHKIRSVTTLHEVRLLRKSSDTMRKGMLLLSICLGLAIVFALLLLQPMLERYYASFGVSSTIASLDHSIEQGIVRRLLQIPWFGGWDIQLIAVQRQNY